MTIEDIRKYLEEKGISTEQRGRDTIEFKTLRSSMQAYEYLTKNLQLEGMRCFNLSTDDSIKWFIDFRPRKSQKFYRRRFIDGI